MRTASDLVGEFRPSIPEDVLRLWAVDVVEFLKFYDLRVTELIRYNSDQVISRRHAAAQALTGMSCLQTIADGDFETSSDAVAMAREALEKIGQFKREDFGRP